MKTHYLRLKLLIKSSFFVLILLISKIDNAQEMISKGSVSIDCYIAPDMAISTSFEDSSIADGILPVWKLKKMDGFCVFIFRERSNGSYEGKSEVLFAFQIPDSNLNYFIYKGDDLLITKALYTYEGSDNILVDSVNFHLSCGVLKGERLNIDEWIVSFSVMIKYAETNNETIFERERLKYVTCKDFKWLE